MKKYLFMITALLVLAQWAVPLSTLAADLMAVKTEGTALKSDDASESKKMALDKALQKAVEDAFATIKKEESVDADTSTLEAGISANPDSYVRNYRVLAEGWITHMDDSYVPPPNSSEPVAPATATSGLDVYHVWIESSVDAGMLREALGRVVELEQRTETDLRVVLLDIGDYGTYDRIVSAIGRIPMIKDCSKDSFYTGKIVLKVKAMGSAFKLKEKLHREIGDGFVVILTGPETIAVMNAHEPVAKQ